MVSRTIYIALRSPKVHVYGVEKSQKRETPGDSVNDDLLSVRGELVDNGAQQKKVDERPVEPVSASVRCTAGHTDQMRKTHGEGVI